MAAHDSEGFPHGLFAQVIDADFLHRAVAHVGHDLHSRERVHVGYWNEPVILDFELAVESDNLVWLEHPFEVGNRISLRVVLVRVELWQVLALR